MAIPLVKCDTCLCPTSIFISFEILTTDMNLARRGNLRVERKSRKCEHIYENEVSSSSKDIQIETPAFMLVTRCGSPENLSPDLLRSIMGSIDSCAFQVSISHIISDMIGPGNYNFMRNGLHHYLGFPSSRVLLYLSDRNPSDWTETTTTVSEKTCRVITRGGITKMSGASFNELAHNSDADIVECVSVNIPYDVKTKRIRKSVDVSLRWLDECLQQRKDCRNNLFGVIQGGCSLQARQHSARETAKRAVAGFVMGSLGLGEDQEQRRTLLEVILKELPKEKPRLIPRIGHPLDVLECIEMGIDLFTSDYPVKFSDVVAIAVEIIHALMFIIF